MYNLRRKKQSKNKQALKSTIGFTIISVSGLFLNNYLTNINETVLIAPPTPPPIITPTSNSLPIQNTPIPTQKNQNETSRGEIKREEFIPEKVIKAIENNLDGVFDKKAQYIYNTSKANNVNPMLMASIMKWETANGTSDLVVNANNPGGINWKKGDKYPKYKKWYVKFPTLEEGIEQNIKLIKRFYIDEGRTDIYSIGAKYAPLDDYRNGIGGMDNSKWSPNITKFYEKILKEAK